MQQEKFVVVNDATRITYYISELLTLIHFQLSASFWIKWRVPPGKKHHTFCIIRHTVKCKNPFYSTLDSKTNLTERCESCLPMFWMVDFNLLCLLLNYNDWQWCMKQTDHMFALNFRVLSVFNPSKNITACQIWMKKNVIIAFCGWSLFTELGAKWNY